MYRALGGRRELGLKRWLAVFQYPQQAFWNLSSRASVSIGVRFWGAVSAFTHTAQTIHGRLSMCHQFWGGDQWCLQRTLWETLLQWDKRRVSGGKKGAKKFPLQDTSVPEDLYALPHLISRILQVRDYQLHLIDESRLKFRQLICAEVRTWTQVCLAPNQVSSPLIVPLPTGTQEEPALRTWTGLWVLMLQKKGCELKGESQDGTQDPSNQVKVKVLVTQSCLTLCVPMDCSLPGSSIHGILQARILEWLPCPPPDSRIEPGSPVLQANSLSSEPPLQTKWTHIETKHRCHPVHMSAF